MSKIKWLLGIIIIILISIFLMIVTYKPQPKMNIVINEPQQEEKFYANNYILLYRNYSGKINLDHFVDKLELIGRTCLPTYTKSTKNLDRQELQKYYEKNKRSLYVNLGITDFSVFEDLIYVLQSLDDEKIFITHADIDLSNYEEDEEYAKFNICFHTKRNKEIKFNVLLNLTGKNTDIYIKFIPIVEE